MPRDFSPHAPVVDGFNVETPVAANSKRRNLSLLEEPVDG